MSIAIDLDRVSGVLLADGWHDVGDSSFIIDAFEFLRQGKVTFGRRRLPSAMSMGAGWIEPSGTTIYCPVSAILAVKTKSESEVSQPTIRRVPSPSSPVRDPTIE